MKQEKKRSSLSRLLSYAGGHRALTVLGCVLSGIAAVLGLAPYFCIWLVARDTLAVFPDFSAATGLTTWGWMAVWFAVANIVFYFAALMCTHIAAFRTARNIRRAAMRHVVSLPLGWLLGIHLGYGLVGIWSAFPVCLSVAGVLYYACFRRRLRSELAGR